MKGILALALCFCLLLALCGLQVSADGGFAVSFAAPETVNAGREFELVCTFPSVVPEGICGFDLEIGFEPEKAEFVSVALSGFPADASWTAVGRTEGALYLLHVFDDYRSSTPVSLYSGTAASVRVKFRALSKASGKARFSAEGRGAVQGCSFVGGEAVSFAGTGGAVSVFVKNVNEDAVREDAVRPLCALRGGVLYALPDCKVGSLGFEGAVVKGADGEQKRDGDRIAAGDILVFGDGFADSPVVLLCDLNADRRFTTADYLLLKRHFAEKNVLAGARFSAADINGDGILSSVDALYMAELLCGGELSLCAAAQQPDT